MLSEGAGQGEGSPFVQGKELSLVGCRGQDEPAWRMEGIGLLSVLTTNLLFTFSRICFSFSAMASPFRFLIRFFSSFLQAYILPVARTWQAHTCGRVEGGHEGQSFSCW